MSDYLNLVLFEPEIPQNTGNLIRLAANMGATLHLIHPLGFELGEKAVRRSGLDYHALACVVEHQNFPAFLRQQEPASLYALSTRGTSNYAAADYRAGDYLLFGPETRGLPEDMLTAMPQDRVLKLPMAEQSRSLNLSNAVAIVAYEAWRQMGFPGSTL